MSRCCHCPWREGLQRDHTQASRYLACPPPPPHLHPRGFGPRAEQVGCWAPMGVGRGETCPGDPRGARAGATVRTPEEDACLRRWGPPAGRAGRSTPCAPGPAPAHARQSRQQHERRRLRAGRQECGTGARAEAAQDGAGAAAGGLRGDLARRGGRARPRPAPARHRERAASLPWPRSRGGPSWSCCSGRGTRAAPTAAPPVGAEPRRVRPGRVGRRGVRPGWALVWVGAGLRAAGAGDREGCRGAGVAGGAGRSRSGGARPRSAPAGTRTSAAGGPPD